MASLSLPPAKANPALIVPVTTPCPNAELNECPLFNPDSVPLPNPDSPATIVAPTVVVDACTAAPTADAAPVPAITPPANKYPAVLPKTLVIPAAPLSSVNALY